ncbi:ribbon-helix-helix domain-containing protein [Patescibacteria group bacterium]|nr:ribbon-helix-helix domain-containing protein [Patescibacteria group bacterium]MBU1703108.1 ribbon-helix-helix domain-containing protein [Patescibacteria group bacterium]MBU1953743.1 ribbon-helix-helix domain-containing protein [Patescibacteria group bacterium]
MAKNIKTRISITIIPTVNILLEKISKKTGKSKSALVENALKDYLQHQLEEEVMELAAMQFDDLPSEDDWLSIQSETNSND